MIGVYLNFPGNTMEALPYYRQAFDAGEPYVMRYTDMPEEDQQSAGPEMKDLVMYSALTTYAGVLEMSDDLPERGFTPNSACWISVTHDNADALRRTFEFLARDGEVIMPMEPAFFSPLYGQVRDKFGYHWMLMLPSPLEGDAAG